MLCGTIFADRMTQLSPNQQQKTTEI